MVGQTTGINQNPHCQNGIKHKFGCSFGGAGKRNGRRIDRAERQKYTPSPRQDSVDGKSLFSRKVVWLEKIKHYFNVFACSTLLKFHIYSDNDERKILKKSRDASRLELKKLQTNEDLHNNQDRFREAFEDGKIKDMVVEGANVVKGFAKKGALGLCHGSE